MSIVKLPEFGMEIGSGKPLWFVLGLNVLEDEKLGLETAQELKNIAHELKIKFVFKASFDKANRSSVKSYRGPGLEKGLKIFEKIKEEFNLPLITDIHEPEQADLAAEVVDILQIPAFLCRQTDLLVAAAKAVDKKKKILHIKKGQFLAPWDCKNIVEKVRSIVPDREITVLCERGVSFGYNNLVVDMLGIPQMQKLGVPVTIDATHAVQLPGGNTSSTGGRREGVEILASAAVAAGCDGVFLEFHPNPDKAKCDGPSCLPLQEAAHILKKLLAIRLALGH